MRCKRVFGFWGYPNVVCLVWTLQENAKLSANIKLLQDEVVQLSCRPIKGHGEPDFVLSSPVQQVCGYFRAFITPFLFFTPRETVWRPSAAVV